jgi:hypothetical protein
MANSQTPKNRSIKPILVGFGVALFVLAIAAYQMMSANRKPTSIQDEDWNVEIDENIEEPIKPEMEAADSMDSSADSNEETQETEQWKPNSGPLKGKSR